MKVGSLFAGIGGFDLAAERAGMEVVWQSEFDPHASRVLDHHWPHIKNLGDIHGISNPATVDILTGGFPCQDYSVAGLRGGLAGDRGALWWEFHRLIAELNPTWVVGENVPGLLSSRDGADFETIVRSLTDLGYGVVWRVLDAQWFGVAQRRRRVFIVAHSGGVPRPEVLALGQSVSGDSPPSREAGTRVAALTANGVGAGGGPDDNAAQAGHLIARAYDELNDSLGDVHPLRNAGQISTGVLLFDPAHRRDGARVQDGDTTPTLSAFMGTGGNNVPAVAFAQNQRDEVRDLGDKAGALSAEPGVKQQTFVLQEVGARQSKNQNGVGIGLSDDDLMYTLQAGQQHGVATSVAVRGRADGQEWELGEPGIANALRAGDGGSSRGNWMTDSAQVRRLTPLECERLQGFPDNWTAIPGNSDSQRYRQLGNAVAVPVVEWIMRRIGEES